MQKIFTKIITTVISGFLVFNLSGTADSSNININFPKPPYIMGASAIVVNSSTGQILYSKNANIRHYPASTTKILTALLAIEHLKQNSLITASATACKIAPDASSAGIKKGECLSVTNCLYALLLDSAGEAANILGEATSGNLQRFVKLMNTKAKLLGCKNSNFVNPSGYHDPNHYTTAYDLSRIAMEAMKYPIFRKIVSTSVYRIPPTNFHKKGIYLSNTNHLINKYRGSAYFYPYAIGIKTGYTSQAQHTLASAAIKNNMELICVVLDSPNAFSDSVKLFNYSFDNFSKVKVLPKNHYLKSLKVKNSNTKVKAVTKNDLTYIKKNNESLKPNVVISYKKNLKAPVKKGSIIGQAKCLAGTEVVDSSPIFAANTAKKLTLSNKLYSYRIPITVGVVVLCLFAGIQFFIYSKKKSRRQFY